MSDVFHEDWRQRALAVERAVSSTIIGQESLIRLITIALFARGHVLLEGRSLLRRQVDGTEVRSGL